MVVFLSRSENYLLYSDTWAMFMVRDASISQVGQVWAIILYILTGILIVAKWVAKNIHSLRQKPNVDAGSGIYKFQYLLVCEWRRGMCLLLGWLPLKPESLERYADFDLLTRLWIWPSSFAWSRCRYRQYGGSIARIALAGFRSRMSQFENYALFCRFIFPRVHSLRTFSAFPLSRTQR